MRNVVDERGSSVSSSSSASDWGAEEEGGAARVRYISRSAARREDGDIEDVNLDDVGCTGWGLEGSVVSGGEIV